MRRLVHTVTLADVGSNYFNNADHKADHSHCKGTIKHIVFVVDVCGYFQAQDIGKNIYDVGGILQIENNEQFKKRQERDRKNAASLIKFLKQEVEKVERNISEYEEQIRSRKVWLADTYKEIKRLEDTTKEMEGQ